MKKTVAVILTTLSLGVSAEVWVAKNQGGGEIVLTNRNVDCKRWPSLLDGYSYTSNGVMKFCWALIDGLIHVAYEDNTSRVYQPEMFTKRNTGQPQQKGQNL